MSGAGFAQGDVVLSASSSATGCWSLLWTIGATEVGGRDILLGKKELLLGTHFQRL